MFGLWHQIVGAIISNGAMATTIQPRSAGSGDSKVQPAVKDAEPSGTTSKTLKVVFVSGGPGSGKGTQCSKIVDKFGFIHLSVGDLLRAEQNSGSENGSNSTMSDVVSDITRHLKQMLGLYTTLAVVLHMDIKKMIREMMVEGKLVPSEMTVKLLLKAMDDNTNDKFLVDGFPRNHDNRETFERMTDIIPEFILFLETTEEEMEKRILGRNQDRDDDNIESIRKRFKVFREETLPVIEQYDSEGKVHKINAMQPIEDVFAEIEPLFEPYIQDDLLQATVKLCQGLDTGNYKIYQQYCHPEVTVFEPQAQGQLVEGMDLRNFKFNLGHATDRLSLSQMLRSTVVAPKVTILNSAVGLVLYTRLLQKPGHPELGYVEAYNETGVWQRLKNDNGGSDWKLVHYHRSVAPTM